MKRTRPERIREYTEHREYRKDTIGRSGSEIFCFSDMVLKAEREKNESRSEHEMLRWLQGRLPVPEIICAEKNGDMRYLLMTKVRGKMLCDEQYLSNPRLLVHLLAEGLKMLWTVDINGCPFKRHLDYKLEQASLRVAGGLEFDEDPDTYGREEFESPEELLLWLKEHRPEEETVFSHGDYCLPNLFAEDNTISGFIDLGRAGTADIWQDIALCVRSLEYNTGKNEGCVNLLFEELGMAPDWDKIRYYILLDELF